MIAECHLENDLFLKVKSLNLRLVDRSTGIVNFEPSVNSKFKSKSLSLTLESFSVALEL